MKYYFKNDDEPCYTLSYWLEYTHENNISEMEVFEAKKDIGSGHFFCKEFSQHGTVGDTCGRLCDKYNPRNGKKGICKHHRYTYECGKSIILKLNKKSNGNNN